MSISNAPEYAALGEKAAKAWKTSAREGAKGDAFAIRALSLAWHSGDFEAFQTTKDGTEKFRHTFTLEMYVKETDKPKEITDKTCQGIRQAAIARDVFGITDEETLKKVKPLIARAMTSVAYLIQQLDLDPHHDIDLSRNGNLIVPFQAVVDEPGDKATDNERKVHAAMIGSAVELDGKSGLSLAKLKSKATPKTDRSSQAATADQDACASVVASAKLVTSVIVGFNTSESKLPAFNQENEKIMHHLFMALSGYFAVDDREHVNAARNAKTQG